MHRTTPFRMLAGAVAVALLAAVIVGAALIAFGLAQALQPPDPFAISSEPCCDVPDDYGAVARGVAGALAATAVDTLLAVAGATLLRWAVMGQAPRRPRRLLLVPVVAVVFVGAISGVTVLAQRGEARRKADCHRLDLDRAAWRLAHCGFLNGD